MNERRSTVTADIWLDTLSNSMKEFVVTTLGYDESMIHIEGANDVPPKNMTGAYMAMVSMDDSIQIGVVSDKTGCRAIAGAMLCMEQEELNELSDPDIADTMGEVVNIIAGMVKTKIGTIKPDINLGLPIFLDGKVEPNVQQELHAIKVKVGDTDTQIVVIKQKDGNTASKS